MTTYWSLLENRLGSELQLTKIDDEILEDFKATFPDFDPTETIDEDKMKSKEGKERWRNFMMKYEKTVSDYNFGTMLRSSPKTEYGEKETIFGNDLHESANSLALTVNSYANAILCHRDCAVGVPLPAGLNLSLKTAGTGLA